MTLFQIVTLAIIQGITEFLPISSSGHLVLAPILMGWEDQGLALDVAVHVGTLGAVIAYLWRDVWIILKGSVGLAVGRSDEGAQLAAFIFVASIPVFIVGFACKNYMGDTLRSPIMIGWAFIGFGILLYLSDRLGLTVKRVSHMTYRSAIMIGIAQSFAIIPGASRAGTTITMARLLGFERRDAARFSMLLSIPAISGAGFLIGKDVLASGDAIMQTNLILAGIFSFATALLAISLMMVWVRRQNYTPFVVYRLALGTVILWLAT